MKQINYTKEQLEPYVKDSLSYTEVARKLGRSPVGGTLTNLKLVCKRFNIDVSHMTNSGHAKGKQSKFKKNSIDWLVLGVNTDHRSKASNLRQGLLALNREEKCADCGIGKEWNGKILTLEIDHKDGKYWNNLPDNLQFLCPNCHSQYGTSNKDMCPRSPKAGDN